MAPQRKSKTQLQGRQWPLDWQKQPTTIPFADTAGRAGPGLGPHCGLTEVVEEALPCTPPFSYHVHCDMSRLSLPGWPSFPH